MHKVPKWFSSLRALLSSLLPHQTLPFWGHISKLLGGGRTYPTRPSEPPALAPSALRAMPPRPLHPEPLGAAVRGRDGLSPAPGPSPGHGHGTWPAELLAQGSFGNTNCFFMTKAIHAHGLQLCTRSKERVRKREDARSREAPLATARVPLRKTSGYTRARMSCFLKRKRKKRKKKEEKRGTHGRRRGPPRPPCAGRLSPSLLCGYQLAEVSTTYRY